MKRIVVLNDGEFSIHEMTDQVFDDLSERADAMLKPGSGSPASHGATHDMLLASSLQQTTDTIMLAIYDEVIDLRGVAIDE